jgi:hypothetical protein
MANLFRIFYVRLRDGGAGWPSEIETLRDWTWGRSPFVRWTMVAPGRVNRSLISHASLIVLDWPAAEAPGARAAYEFIRRTARDAKVLVVKSGDDPNRDRIVRDKARATGTNMDPHAYGVFSEELCGREVQETFKRVRDELGVALWPATVQLSLDDKDLSLSELRKWVRDDRLKLIVQKFFPEAKKAQICSVGGGWSGARLCRLFIDGGSELYFLKFSENGEQYERDFTNHIEAKKWLGGAAVDLRRVPGQGGGFRLQQQAFPLRPPPLLPLCFLSASTHHHPRETLYALYRSKPQDFLEKAFGRLIASLGANQPSVKDQPHSTPWSNLKDDPFCLKEEMVRNTLAAMDDLKLYGPPFCQNSAQQWGLLCLQVAALFGAKLPAWLSNPLPVVVGHTHGDPNPRNCLVHPDDPLDMQWIDCGDYRADGRLVSDLAIVERDIKLVLLGTERDVDGFFDLDVQQIPDWCRAEHDSIEKGIGYKSENALGNPQKPCGVFRAYRLIGLVRQRAKELDPDGKHYFAALLYWTLDALKYAAVRPTKKLLALYSVSDILRRFGG